MLTESDRRELGPWNSRLLVETVERIVAAHVARATADAEAIARLAEESEAGWRREADEQALRANNAEARLAAVRAEALRAAATRWRPFVADGRCPTCQMGRSRETTGLVCQTCGTDYAAPSAPDPQEER